MSLDSDGFFKVSKLWTLCTQTWTMTNRQKDWGRGDGKSQSGSGAKPADDLSLSLEFNTALWILHQAAPRGFVTGAQTQATHLNTHWRSPRWPWPRVYLGKKGDISGSHLPLCDVGRHKPNSRVPPQSTRWRDRYTYIWGEHRQIAM